MLRNRAQQVDLARANEQGLVKYHAGANDLG